ncbi:hypothetical protein JCM12141A_04150 [Mycolicibacterium hodleri]
MLWVPVPGTMSAVVAPKARAAANADPTTKPTAPSIATKKTPIERSVRRIYRPPPNAPSSHASADSLGMLAQPAASDGPIDGRVRSCVVAAQRGGEPESQAAATASG